MKAAKLYQGEFLPALSTETWVMMESLQLKRVFETCVRWLGDYLKKQKDYEAAYRLYTRAAKIYPFDDWQVHQIDSLICRGEYKEAYRLYDKDVYKRQILDWIYTVSFSACSAVRSTQPY